MFLPIFGNLHDRHQIASEKFGNVSFRCVIFRIPELRNIQTILRIQTRRLLDGREKCTFKVTVSERGTSRDSFARLVNLHLLYVGEKSKTRILSVLECLLLFFGIFVCVSPAFEIFQTPHRTTPPHRCCREGSDAIAILATRQWVLSETTRGF